MARTEAAAAPIFAILFEPGVTKEKAEFGFGELGESTPLFPKTFEFCLEFLFLESQDFTSL